jgi:CheY-like chemotaxis protein
MAKIVVLEDDISTRHLITEVLKRHGHEVSDVDNGAEGLLTVMAEQPDIVISDVEMPKMNGFEVLSDIRSTPEIADTPVILLTSLSSRADIRKGMNHGADDYITKPFQPDELIQAVRSQLNRLSTRRMKAGLRPIPVVEPIQPPVPQQAEILPSEFQPERDSEPLSGFASTSAGELMDSLPGLSSFPVLEDSAALALADPMVDHRLDTQSELVSASYLPSLHIDKAWAIHMRVLNEEALQSKLPTKVWRSLLRELFIPVNRDKSLRIADYLDLVDSRITLYFVDRKDGRGALRAARALQAMVLASTGCRNWAAEVFSGMGVPAPRVAIDLHVGSMEVVRVPLDFGGERDTVRGSAVQLLHALRTSEPRVMWRVLITDEALQQSPGLYRLGAKTEISVGTQDVIVHAVQGVVSVLAQGSGVEPAHWI